MESQKVHNLFPQGEGCAQGPYLHNQEGHWGATGVEGQLL